MRFAFPPYKLLKLILEFEGRAGGHWSPGPPLKFLVQTSHFIAFPKIFFQILAKVIQVSWLTVDNNIRNKYHRVAPAPSQAVSASAAGKVGKWRVVNTSNSV